MSDSAQNDAFSAISEQHTSGSSGYDLSSLPEASSAGMPNPAEEEAPTALQDRVVHKDWKVRSKAFAELEALLKMSEEESPCMAEYAPRMAKAVTDSNAIAQTAGVGAFRAFAEAAAEALVSETAETVAPLLVSKCLSGRPNTVRAAADALLAILDAGCVEHFLDAVVAGLKDRKSKVPPQCGALLVAAATKYGKSLPLGRFVDVAKANMTTTNSGLRQEMKNLTGVLSVRVGASAVSAISAGLRDALVKELEAAAEEAAKNADLAAPPTLLRPQRLGGGGHVASLAPGAGAGAGAGAGGAVGSGVEAVALVGDGGWSERSPVHVLQGLDPEQAIQSKKWSERKTVFETFVERCGPDPKLANDDDYAPLLRAVETTLKKDAIVAVAVAALNAVEKLASGRRESAREEMQSFLGHAMAKFKEKKAAVVAAAQSASLSILTHSVSVEEALPALTSASDSPLPQVQQGALDLIGSLFEKASLRVAAPGALGPILGLLERKLSETNPGVRESACQGLGKAVALLGVEGPLRAVLARIESGHTHQHKRILDVAGPNPGQNAAAILAAANPPKQARAASAPPTKPKKEASKPPVRTPRESSKPVIETQEFSEAEKPARSPTRKAPVRGPPARLLCRAKPAAAAAPSPEKPKATGRPAAGGDPDADFKGEPLSEPPTFSGGTDGKGLKTVAQTISDRVGESRPDLSADDAGARLSGLPFPGGWAATASGLQSSKWKERKDAFDAMAEVFATNGSAGNAEAAIALALAHTKQMKESNVNVVKAAAGMATAAIQGANDAPVAFRALKHLLDPLFGKLGDRRAKDAIPPLALAACESVGPQFVLGVVYGAILKPAARAPLLQQNALELVLAIVREFGASSVQVVALVEYCKTDRGLEARNKGVRDAACTVLAEVHRQLGQGVCKLLGDLKKQLADELASMFMSVGVSAASQPKRAVKAAAKGLVAEDSGEPARERADVAKALTGKMLSKIKMAEGKDAWKARLEGVKEVLGVLDSADRFVQPCKQLRDVLLALKQRFTDKNANVKARSVAAVGVVGESLGVKAAFFSKFVLADMMPCAADSKRGTHDAFIGALNGWAIHEPESLAGGKRTVLLDVVLHYACPTLDDTANSRETLLTWMGEFVHPWIEGEYEFTPAAHAQGPPAVVLRASANSLVQCLADRNKSVRDAATVLLSACVRVCGQGPVRKALRDLKPATLRAMQPYLDSVYSDAEARGSVGIAGTDEGEGAQGGDDGVPPSKTNSPPRQTEPKKGRTDGAPVDGGRSVPSSPARASSSTRGSRMPRSPSGRSQTRGSQADAAPRSGPRRAATALHRRPGAHGDDASGSGSATGVGTRRGVPARAASRARVSGIRKTQSSRDGASSQQGQHDTATGRAPASRFRSGRRTASQIPRTLAAATRKVQEEVEAQRSAPALKKGPDGAKAVRERRSAREKWSADLLNADLVSRVQDGTSAVADPELQKQMWSRNARDHVLAAVRLARAVREEVDETVSNLDLIFRWVAVRLCDRENVQATARLSELLLQVFSMLEGMEYRLSEYEALSLVPFLVEKLGHPKQRFRDAFKKVFGLFVRCYTRQGAVLLLLDGLRSKNMRARVECLDELGNIMDGRRTPRADDSHHGRYDWQVLGRRGLTRVAAQVNENDTDVRKAALGVLEMAWVAFGRDFDALLAQIPKVPTKVKGLMEERFKFSTLQSEDEASDSELGDEDSPRRQVRAQVDDQIGYSHSAPPAPDTVDVDALVVEIDKTLSSSRAAGGATLEVHTSPATAAVDRVALTAATPRGAFNFERPSFSSTPSASPSAPEVVGSEPRHGSVKEDVVARVAARRQRAATCLFFARSAIGRELGPVGAVVSPGGGGAALGETQSRLTAAIGECRALVTSVEGVLSRKAGDGDLGPASLVPIKVITDMAKDAVSAGGGDASVHAVKSLLETPDRFMACLTHLLYAGLELARENPDGFGGRIASNCSVAICRLCDVTGLLQRTSPEVVRDLLRVCGSGFVEAAEAGKATDKGLSVVMDRIVQHEATAPALHAMLSVALLCASDGSAHASTDLAGEARQNRVFVSEKDATPIIHERHAGPLADLMVDRVKAAVASSRGLYHTGPRGLGPDASNSCTALVSLAAAVAVMEDAMLHTSARPRALRAAAQVASVCVDEVKLAWVSAGKTGDQFQNAMLEWCGGDQGASALTLSLCDRVDMSTGTALASASHLPTPSVMPSVTPSAGRAQSPTPRRSRERDSVASLRSRPGTTETGQGDPMDYFQQLAAKTAADAAAGARESLTPSRSPVRAETTRPAEAPPSTAQLRARLEKAKSQSREATRAGADAMGAEIDETSAAAGGAGSEAAGEEAGEAAKVTPSPPPTAADADAFRIRLDRLRKRMAACNEG